MNVFTGSFSDLSDPREDGKVIYPPLTDVLVIAVCPAIAGAESYEDIVLYGKSKTDWLSEFLELKGGIPSHDTFRRVFSLIDAEAFEACFTEWVVATKDRCEPPFSRLALLVSARGGRNRLGRNRELVGSGLPSKAHPDLAAPQAGCCSRNAQTA